MSDDYSYEEKSSGAGSSVGAFLLGIGVGLGVSLLFTPRSGEENRQFMADRAREGMDRATLAVGEIKDQVQASLSNASDAAQDVKQRVSGTVADLKDRVQEAVRAGQQAYHQDLERSEAEQEGGASRAATTGS